MVREGKVALLGASFVQAVVVEHHCNATLISSQQKPRCHMREDLVGITKHVAVSDQEDPFDGIAGELP